MKKAWMASAFALTVIGGGLTFAHAQTTATNSPQNAVSVQNEVADKETADEQGTAVSNTEEQDINDQAEQAKLQQSAKITKQQSIELAFKSVQGAVQSAELNDENGVPVYVVAIKDGKGTVQEVKVDAVLGKVIATEQAGTEQSSNENGTDNQADGEQADDTSSNM
jgi:uncharacterized membrane protein YkoI